MQVQPSVSGHIQDNKSDCPSVSSMCALARTLVHSSTAKCDRSADPVFRQRRLLHTESKGFLDERASCGGRQITLREEEKGGERSYF